MSRTRSLIGPPVQAVENASSLSISLEKGFIVGGASSGGNLAAVSVNRARDDPFFDGRPITGQLLDYPVTIHPQVVPEKSVLPLRTSARNAAS